jgi:hypothetical protein
LPKVTRSTRLLVFLAGLVSVLALTPLASAAGKADGASGVIFFTPGIGCSYVIFAADGSFLFGGSPLATTFLGGDVFTDDHVGWVCTGPANTVPAIDAPLVLTGLTCRVDNVLYPFLPPRPGVLTSSGTAIFQSGGDARLVCPPATRS